MSWDAFKGDLVSRVASVPGTGKVHSYWPLCSDAQTHPRFKELFVKDDVFNTWMFRCEGFGGEFGDHDTLESMLYRISLSAFRALKDDAEIALVTALNAVRQNFRNGDRTLGGKVNTLSVIEWEDIVEAKFMSTSCIRAEGSFLVEVIESTGATADDPVPPVYPPYAITAKEKAIGDGVLLWASDHLTAPLSLQSCGWSRSLRAQPVYPVDARNRCPLLSLRVLTVEEQLRAARGVDFDMVFSLYYYRRQTPGQNHQQILMNDTKLIKETFLNTARPAPPAVVSAGGEILRPIQTVYHDDLRHPRVDDPALRVSCSETVWGVMSHDRS